MRVPVVREQERVRSVLSADVATSELRDILLRPTAAAGVDRHVLDPRRLIIARTRAEEQFVGQPASSPCSRRAPGRPRAGTAVSRRKAPQPTRPSAARPSPASRWPWSAGRARSTRRLPAPLWGIAGAGALFLALGIVIAVFFARRIAGPDRALSAGAPTGSGRGAEPPPLRTRSPRSTRCARPCRKPRGSFVDERRRWRRSIAPDRCSPASSSLERLVQGVTDASTRLCRAVFGAFFYNVADQHGEAYTLYAISGVPREAFANFPMPRNTDLFGPTFRGEGVVRIDDVTRDPRYGRVPPTTACRADICRSAATWPFASSSRTGEVLGGLFFGHPDAGRVHAPRRGDRAGAWPPRSPRRSTTRGSTRGSRPPAPRPRRPTRSRTSSWPRCPTSCGRR